MSSSREDASAPRGGSTWLGLLAVALFAAHGTANVLQGHPENMLWACNVAVLAVGVGLLLRSPLMNAVGSLWLVVGLPLWALYLLEGGECLPTSPLSHLGGLVLGSLGSRKLGFPRNAWWKASLFLVLLHLFSRWATPPQENVNLAHFIWPGWEDYFPSHLSYGAVVLSFYVTASLAVELGWRRLTRCGRAEAGP